MGRDCGCQGEGALPGCRPQEQEVVRKKNDLLHPPRSLSLAAPLQPYREPTPKEKCDSQSPSPRITKQNGEGWAWRGESSVLTWVPIKLLSLLTLRFTTRLPFLRLSLRGLSLSFSDPFPSAVIGGSLDVPQLLWEGLYCADFNPALVSRSMTRVMNLTSSHSSH